MPAGVERVTAMADEAAMAALTDARRVSRAARVRRRAMVSMVLQPDTRRELQRVVRGGRAQDAVLRNGSAFYVNDNE